MNNKEKLYLAKAAEDIDLSTKEERSTSYGKKYITPDAANPSRKVRHNNKTWARTRGRSDQLAGGDMSNPPHRDAAWDSLNNSKGNGLAMSPKQSEAELLKKLLLAGVPDVGAPTPVSTESFPMTEMQPRRLTNSTPLKLGEEGLRSLEDDVIKSNIPLLERFKAHIARNSDKYMLGGGAAALGLGGYAASKALSRDEEEEEEEEEEAKAAASQPFPQSSRADHWLKNRPAQMIKRKLGDTARILGTSMAFPANPFAGAAMQHGLKLQNAAKNWKTDAQDTASFG